MIPNTMRSRLLRSSIAVLFNLSDIAVQAQYTYYRTCALPFGYYTTGTDATLDGGAVITGVHSANTGFLVRFGHDGYPQWLRTYTGTSDFGLGGYGPLTTNFFEGVAALPNGNIMVGGSCTGELTNDRSVLLFDSLGSPLLGHASGTPQHNEHVSMVTNGGGPSGIIAGGDPNLVCDHAVAYRVAADGTTGLAYVWVGGTTSTSPLGIASCPGGGMLMSFGWPNLAQLARFNSSMNIAWQHAWSDFTPTRLCSDGHGRTLAVSESSIIAYFDSSGVPQWTEHITVPIGGIVDAVFRTDGRILVMGNFFLLLLDSAGALLWAQRYGDEGDGLMLERLFQRGDGTLLMVGKAQGGKLCLISTNADGTLDGCSYAPVTPEIDPVVLTADGLFPVSGTLGTGQLNNAQLTETAETAAALDTMLCPLALDAERDVERDAIIILPNPAHGSVRIEFAGASSARTRVKLMDAQGRIARSMETDGGGAMIVPLVGMEAGVYFIAIDRQRIPPLMRVLVVE